ALASLQPGRIYDLNTGRELYESPSWLSGLRFLADGRTVVTNERSLWDAETGKALRNLDVRMPSSVSPDGKHFVEWGAEALSLRALPTGKEVRALPPLPTGCTYTLTFSADGRTLAAVGGKLPHEAPKAASLRFWDVSAGTEQKPISLDGCPRPVN